MRMTNVRLHGFLSNSLSHSTVQASVSSCPLYRELSLLEQNAAWRSRGQVKVKFPPFSVEFGTNAYPLKSLSGVLDGVSDATVKSQRPR